MDTKAHVWTIPPTRMKMTREHRVPLSGRSMDILDAARSFDDSNPLVFPNRFGQPHQGHVPVRLAQET